MDRNQVIKSRERDVILQALRAGVVPKTGQLHIQVARDGEIAALLGDLDRIADGGSAVRFVIGDFGSGKTFFLALVRAMALERKLVTVHADLNPERRLHATGGQARSLYQELTRNLSTRTKPDGNALPTIVEKFVTSALDEAKVAGQSPDGVIHRRLELLHEFVGGYDFAEVVAAYWRGYDEGDEVLKTNAVRWLRGEFSTRSDARKALGVRTIVEDENVYDTLKLLSCFVRLSGFSGMVVLIDEMVNIYKLTNAQARKANYEQILRIVNDNLQGSASGLGFVFGGTPDFLMNPSRGLYSYEALQTRLQENSFARGGLTDLSGPIIRLESLTPEDLYVLLMKLRHVHAFGDPAHYLIPDEGLVVFLQHCRNRLGDACFRTPRNTVKAFLNVLDILEQNENTNWTQLIGQVSISNESNTDGEDEELATLVL